MRACRLAGLLAALGTASFREVISALKLLGQAGHFAAGGRVVVNVAVALAVADALHERGDCVAKVKGHRLARRRGGIGGGGRVGLHHEVRLGCLGQIDGCLGQWKEGFGQTDQVGDLCCRGGLHHRVRVGQADVFGSQDAQPSRDEDWIGPAFDHSRQPVQCGARIGVSHRFDEGRDQVVMVFALAIVGEASAAEGLDQGCFGDVTAAVWGRCGCFDGILERGKCDAGVAAGPASELIDEIRIDAWVRCARGRGLGLRGRD